MSSQAHKSPLRLQRFKEFQFIPRFEYGDMAESAELCGPGDGTRPGTGFAHMKNANIPWTIQYDEVLIVIEGELRVHVHGEIHALYPRDRLWLPTGYDLIYESGNAVVAYAIYPSNWQEA